MNTKFRLFRHTFIVLSIMCCILLGSTSIILALGNLNTPEFSAGVSGSSQNSKAATASDWSPELPAPNNVPAASETASGKSVAIAAGSASESSVNLADETASEPSAQSQSESKAAIKPAENADNDYDSTKSQVSEEKNSTPIQDSPDLVSSPASITISAVGDIMAHQSNLNNAYSPKTRTYDFTGFLEYVKPYLSKADVTIGNFETVTAGPMTGYSSYPSFNTPDAILTALQGAGFDILSTANNHCLDRGITGLIRTIQTIGKNKMVNVGSSINGRNKYIVKDVNGIKLGVLAYSGFYNGLDNKLSAAQKNTYLNPVNELQIQKDIKAAKALHADAVIVIAHWGTEYQRVPNSSQNSLAKKMLSWGADIILGSHPHVIQKSEIVKVNGKNKFIIYSMGNFISGYRRVDHANRPNKVYTEDGVIVNLQLEKDAKSGITIKSVDYVPTWVDKYYANNRPVFKIIPIPKPDISEKYITDYNRSFVKQSYKNTMGIMAKMN